MISITAVIVAKEYPLHFFDSLSSVEDFVSEIIIGSINLDKQIVDRLRNNKKARIIELSSDIAFADLIKEDLKQKAKGNYILYLDPDEIFPQGAKKTLLEKISRFDFFFFPRKNIIFGKWINHSRWWPDYQLRFFKKNSVVWPKTIHPIPETKGLGYHFEAEEKNAICHYNYESIDEYFEKAVRYAKSEAKEAVAKNHPVTLSETVKKSISEFISRFFAHEGYKDGVHGLILAFFQMFYYLLVYAFYWENNKYSKEEEKTVIVASREYFRSGLVEANHWLVKNRLTNKITNIKIKLVNKILTLLKY